MFRDLPPGFEPVGQTPQTPQAPQTPQMNLPPGFEPVGMAASAQPAPQAPAMDIPEGFKPVGMADAPAQPDLPDPTVAGRIMSGPRAIGEGAVGSVGAAIEGAGILGQWAGIGGQPMQEAGANLGQIAQDIGPEEQYRNFFTDVAGGVGSMGTYLVPGAVAGGLLRGASAGARATAQMAGAVGLAAPSGASEAYNRAVQQGVEHEDALNYGALGTIPGAVQVAPVAVLLRRLPPNIQGRAWEQARRIGEAFGAEFTAEGTGAILQNLIEQSYNPERGTWDDTLYRGAVGGSSAALLQLGINTLTRGRGAAPGQFDRGQTEGADADGAEGAVDLGAAEPAMAPDPAAVPPQGQVGAGVETAGTPGETGVEGVAPGAVQTPPEAGAQPAPASRRRVTYGDNQSIETDFEIVDLDTLQRAEGDLQPRDRTRATSDEQIAEIAGRLDPSRLMDSAEADRGAPIVGPDNVVESGNARVQALRIAAERFPDQYEAYRRAILDSGFAEAAEGIQRPALVRRRATPLDDAQRRQFVIDANRPSTLAMSAAERARADRDALTNDVMDLYQPDASSGVLAASNRRFVQGFLRQLPQTERAALADDQGRLSQEGVRRVQGALIARAYGDDGTLAQQLEATDDNAKALSGAMLDAAGAWGQMRRAAEAGNIPANLDATRDLLRAVEMVRQAREQGEKVRDLVNQEDAFDPVTDATRELVRGFFRDDALTKPAGRAKVAEMLRRYAEEAQRQSAEPNLLGEQAGEVSAADIARAARTPRQAGLGLEAAEDAPMMDAADETGPRAALEALRQDDITIEQTPDGFEVFGFDEGGDALEGGPFATQEAAIAAAQRALRGDPVADEQRAREIETGIAGRQQQRIAQERARQERDRATRREQLSDPSSWALGPAQPLGDALRAVRNTVPDGIDPALWRSLVNRLAQVVGDVPVYRADDAFMRVGERGRRDGFYSVPDNLVAMRDGLEAGEYARVLVHEAIHAATKNVLETNARAREDFDRLFDAAIRRLTGQGAWVDAALKNLDEFVAHALTDTRFQNAIADIPAPRWMRYDGNLFSAFVEKVRQWALRNLNVSEPTMLEAVVRATEQALDARAEQTERPARRERQVYDEMNDLDEQAPLQDDTRRGGGLAPGTAEVSQTRRGTWNEDAFIAMGEDANEMRARPAGEQIRRLIPFVKEMFGFKDVARTGPQGQALAVDARDNLLDLFRNGQFMAHVLGMPNEGLGLLKTLTVNFERDTRRYFGVYDPATRSISLPGRSNSFAHEFAHALDHFLNERLNDKPGLMSKLGRKDGLDADPGSIQEAFVTVLNEMFFDQAGLAQKLLTLQAQADQTIKQGPRAGQPTKQALKAQEQIDAIKRGAGKVKGVGSKYRSTSREFGDGSPYWTNPAEMLARAFEAYVAHKVENVGGTNEVITKGDNAYRSDADDRLAMTFPKAEERIRIFKAFDDLFAKMREENLFGADATAPLPGDHGVLDPARHAKVNMTKTPESLKSKLKSETARFINLLRGHEQTWRDFRDEIRYRAGVSDMPANQKYSVWRRWGTTARQLYWSTASMMRWMGDRNGPAGLWTREFIVDRLADDPGSGRFTGETFERAGERRTKQFANRLTDVLTANDIPLYNRDKAQVKRLRALTLGTPRAQVAGATDAEVKVAAEIRRLLDDMYRYARDAGIDMGYIGEHNAYLQRDVNRNAVANNQQGFIKAATKVYEALFDSEVGTGDALDADALATKIRAVPLSKRSVDLNAAIEQMRSLRKQINRLSGQLEGSPDPDQVQAQIDQLTEQLTEATGEVADILRGEWSDMAARDWEFRIRVGTPIDMDTLGPRGDFTQSRTLPAIADEVLGEFYTEDPVASTFNYMYSLVRKAEYTRRFGQTRGNQKLDNIISRNRQTIERRARKYDQNTPDGRRAILRDFADPTVDNISEIALGEFSNEGAASEDVHNLCRYLENLSGQQRIDAGTPTEIINMLYVVGTFSLLPRAMWASIAEPTNVYLRTGSFRASWKMLSSLTRQAFDRNATDVREWNAIARMIGLTADGLHETGIANRFNLNPGDTIAGQHALSHFFERSGLSPMTRAQWRAALPSSWVFLRQLAQKIESGSQQEAELARRELNSIGMNPNMERTFVQAFMSHENLPGVDFWSSPMGEAMAPVMHTLAYQIIQNPQRVNRPIYASNPIGRMALGITAFSFEFFRNTIWRTVNSTRTRREVNQALGMSRLGAGAEAYGSIGVQFASGAAMLTLAQMLVSVAREAIFNGERWEEKEREGELGPWLLQLGFSRTGLIGPGDVIWQAISGLRYQRDLTTLYAGPHVSWVLQHTGNIVNAFTDNNSPNSNTAEYRAVKSAYQLFATPAIAYGLSAIPGGPIISPGASAALQWFTSNKAADDFATAIVGERDSRRDPPGLW